MKPDSPQPHESLPLASKICFTIAALFLIAWVFYNPVQSWLARQDFIEERQQQLARPVFR